MAILSGLNNFSIQRLKKAWLVGGSSLTHTHTKLGDSFQWIYPDTNQIERAFRKAGNADGLETKFQELQKEFGEESQRGEQLYHPLYGYGISASKRPLTLGNNSHI